MTTNTQFRIKFVASDSMFIVQCRHETDWWWKTCRMPPSDGVRGFINHPWLFGTVDQARTFIKNLEKMDEE